MFKSKHKQAVGLEIRALLGYKGQQATEVPGYLTSHPCGAWLATPLGPGGGVGAWQQNEAGYYIFLATTEVGHFSYIY